MHKCIPCSLSKKRPGTFLTVLSAASSVTRAGVMTAENKIINIHFCTSFGEHTINICTGTEIMPCFHRRIFRISPYIRQNSLRTATMAVRRLSCIISAVSALSPLEGNDAVDIKCNNAQRYENAEERLHPALYLHAPAGVGFNNEVIPAPAESVAAEQGHDH